MVIAVEHLVATLRIGLGGILEHPGAIKRRLSAENDIGLCVSLPWVEKRLGAIYPYPTR